MPGGPIAEVWQVKAPALRMQPDRLTFDGDLLLFPVHRTAALGTSATVLRVSVGSRRERRRGGNFLVKLARPAIFGFSIRPSVQTRMAVGEVGVFRSVRTCLADASKNARSAHLAGVWTLGRFGMLKLTGGGILTGKIGLPGFLETAAPVAFGVQLPSYVNGFRDDAEGPEQASELLLGQRFAALPLRPWAL